MYTISLLTALIEYLTILLKYIDTILQIIFITFVNDIPHIVRSDVYICLLMILNYLEQLRIQTTSRFFRTIYTSCLNDLLHGI